MTTNDGRFWFTRAQAVADPRADARPGDEERAGVDGERGLEVLVVVGGHRADEADVVHLVAEVREEVADQRAALAAAAELPARLEQRPLSQRQPAADAESLAVGLQTASACGRTCPCATRRRSRMRCAWGFEARLGQSPMLSGSDRGSPQRVVLLDDDRPSIGHADQAGSSRCSLRVAVAADGAKTSSFGKGPNRPSIGPVAACCRLSRHQTRARPRPAWKPGAGIGEGSGGPYSCFSPIPCPRILAVSPYTWGCLVHPAAAEGGNGAPARIDVRHRSLHPPGSSSGCRREEPCLWRQSKGHESSALVLCVCGPRRFGTPSVSWEVDALNGQLGQVSHARQEHHSSGIGGA